MKSEMTKRKSSKGTKAGRKTFPRRFEIQPHSRYPVIHVIPIFQSPSFYRFSYLPLRLFVFASLCVCAFLFISCSSLRLSGPMPESSQSWPMFGRDAAHNSSSDIVSTKLEKVWDYDVSAGFGGFSPTIRNGVVSVGTLKGEVYFIDASSGKKEASKGFGGAIFSGPVLSDSLVIAASSGTKDNLFVYNLYSGNKVWTKTLTDVESSPTLWNDAVFVATVGGDLYKFNVKNGVEIFHRHLPAPVRVSPAVSDSLCVFGCDDGNVYAISPADGKQIWKYSTGSPVWCSASMRDSLIFVGTTGGKLLMLREDGTLLFDFPVGGKILSMPVSDGRDIYFGCNDGDFYAVNEKSGAPTWKVETGAPIVAAASQTKTQIIFGSYDENLYVVDKDDGKVTQKINLPGRAKTAPAIYGGYLVVGVEDTDVLCFAIK